MSGVNQFLKENLGEAIPKIHLAPGIPEKKINNAIAKAARLASPQIFPAEE